MALRFTRLLFGESGKGGKYVGGTRVADVGGRGQRLSTEPG